MTSTEKQIIAAGETIPVSDRAKTLMFRNEQVRLAEEARAKGLWSIYEAHYDNACDADEDLQGR